MSLSLSFKGFIYLFIYLTERETAREGIKAGGVGEGEAGGVGEEEAGSPLSREPNAGLDPSDEVLEPK